MWGLHRKQDGGQPWVYPTSECTPQTLKHRAKTQVLFPAILHGEYHWHAESVLEKLPAHVSDRTHIHAVQSHRHHLWGSGDVAAVHLCKYLPGGSGPRSDSRGYEPHLLDAYPGWSGQVSTFSRLSPTLPSILPKC